MKWIRLNYLKKSLSNIAKAKKKDKDGSQFVAFKKELDKIYSKSSDIASNLYSNKKSREAKSIYILIAKAFGDTLPNYRDMLAKQRSNKPKANDNETEISERFK